MRRRKATKTIRVMAGVPCFSPIIHSHHVARICGIDPFSHAIWLPAERPMLDAAMGLIVLQIDGWCTSVGLCEEIDLFVADARPIIPMMPGVVPSELLDGTYPRRREGVTHGE